MLLCGRENSEHRGRENSEHRGRENSEHRGQLLHDHVVSGLTTTDFVSGLFAAEWRKGHIAKPFPYGKWFLLSDVEFVLILR